METKHTLNFTVECETPWKKTLDPQLFIYLAAVDKDFRTKYFANPDAISQDFNVSNENLAVIKRIDFGKLNQQIDAISGELHNMERSTVEGKTVFEEGCHDNGHCNSQGPGHTNCVHNNNCPKGMSSHLNTKMINFLK
jgi:hypothetical protein